MKSGCPTACRVDSTNSLSDRWWSTRSFASHVTKPQSDIRRLHSQAFYLPRGPSTAPGSSFSSITRQRFISLSEIVTTASYSMTPHDPSQSPSDPDKALPKFDELLNNLSRWNLHQNGLPSLQSGSSAWLVEYLDSVRLKITLRRAVMLNVAVDPRRYIRSRRPHTPGVFAGTPKDMQRQGTATEIVYTARIGPWRCVRGDVQWFEGTRKTREDVPWRRPTEG